MGVPINTDSMLALALIFDGHVEIARANPDGEGWRIRLPNGARVSIQWSETHNCSGRNPATGEISNAEVYAWWPEHLTTGRRSIMRDPDGFRTFSNIGGIVRKIAGLSIGQRLCHCGEPEGNSDHCSACGCEENEQVCC